MTHARAYAPDIAVTTLDDATIGLVPLTSRGEAFLDTYPNFNGEELTLPHELLPSLRGEAAQVGVTLNTPEEGGLD